MGNKNFKIKKLRLQLSVAIILLIAVLISGFFVFSPVSWQQAALAVTGNYSKVSGTDQLTVGDWNNLPSDFLDKSGDTMNGDLTVPNLTVTGSCTGCGGGGDTFINWGRADCPAGTNELYDGYVFSASWPVRGGGANWLCIKDPLVGTELPPSGQNPGATFSSRLNPLAIGTDYTTPSGIPGFRELKCAMCYKPSSVCYESYGDASCNASEGFSSVSTGWIIGGLNNINRENQNDWKCLNDDFSGANASNDVDNTLTVQTYGATIESDDDKGMYVLNEFIRCSICCN